MNTVSIDLYAVLGLSKDADLAAIRTAFRARMRQSHPDGRPPAEAAAAHDEMVLLNLAYETLMDPGKRAVYDLDCRAAGNAKREQYREPPPPPPPAPPPQPRTIVLNHRYINLGPVWTGAEAQEQVVEAGFDDGSPIRFGRVLNTMGSFWHVTSEPLVHDATCLIIRIQGGLVAPDHALGRLTERLNIHLDGVTATVGVTAFIRTPPAPPPSLANWRHIRLTVLGWKIVLGFLVLLIVLLLGAEYILDTTVWEPDRGQHPPTKYAVDLDYYCWPETPWLPGQRSATDLTGRRIHAPRAAFTWSCGRNGPKLTQKDFDTACQDQYPRTTAEPGDRNDAYSWMCR
ncbi:J domain-containing protein [Streptomyces sp. SID12488]|uniref:J domain-containing protein n=1 Tax=Streptomyces sp. SID12488 TaxID=2706040 RepID=UPI0013DB184C|nr:J domain-containing protein [Streptomyces sp. SID12488]NEA65377.1 J domain-containing protein [Streptomyces sp. SID12488]